MADEPLVTDLVTLATATRYRDWLFAQYQRHIRGTVAEVGPGLGTYTRLILDNGARRLVLVESNERCLQVLGSRFGADKRVTLIHGSFPHAALGVGGALDLIICQNVLEHIADDRGAVVAMADALALEGRLALIVPAGPRLYGRLDRAYGHHRRYQKRQLENIVAASGLSVESSYRFNAFGVAAWWLNNRLPGTRMAPWSVQLFDQIVRLAEPVENRIRPPVGLSLVCIATKAR